MDMPSQYSSGGLKVGSRLPEQAERLTSRAPITARPSWLVIGLQDEDAAQSCVESGVKLLARSG